VRNPLYSGWRIYSTGREAKKVVSRRGRSYKRKVPLPEDEIIRVKVVNPPQVAEDRFVRVQEILAATLKNWKGERADRPAYNLLRSVARCAHCDSRLYFSQDRRRPNTMGYYFCSCNYYRKRKKGTCGIQNQSNADLDAATLGFFNGLLTKPAVWDSNLSACFCSISRRVDHCYIIKHHRNSRIYQNLWLVLWLLRQILSPV
jgi:hypothetical protein